jgi:hypothetical protein
MASDPSALFVDSPESRALEAVPADARRVVARRLYAALAETGKPLDKLGSSEVHGWLLHAVPDQFKPRDPLLPHVLPVLKALLDFSERTAGRKLDAMRASSEELFPDLEEVLVTGHAHHHGDHDEHAPEVPFVREQPKVGRNDPCTCGSGKKFKKCHGANAS